MERKARLSKLMKQAADAHGAFSERWREVRATELARRGLAGRTLSESDQVMQEMFAANGAAYAAAEPEAERRDRVLRQVFEMIPSRARLRSGLPDAVDDALDFLEVPVRAFR